MITVSPKQNSRWQESFVLMLPEIQRRLRRAFRGLNPADREESIEEAVVHCVLAYARLHERGRTHVARPSTLVFYAARQVRRGRPTVGKMNGNEPLSRYGQVSNGITIDHSQWIETLATDKRAAVLDQVAARLDVRAWFATLSNRLQRIARDLAVGCSTGEVARKYGVTAGRISQIRRSLEESWKAFQSEPERALVC